MFRWVRRVAILAAFVPRIARAQPAPAAPEKVRVAYDAPEGCPRREIFLEQVRSRLGADWEAPPGVLAHTIEVRVESSPGRSVARVDFEERGQRVSRVVSATTCDEVVSGIALVTALAIESRVGESRDPGEPAPEAPPLVGAQPAANAAPPRPAAAAPASPPPAAASAPQAATSARGTPRRPAAFHVDVGLGGLVNTGVGPSLAWGGRFFAGAGFRHGPDFRFGVDYTQSPEVDELGAPTRFYLLGLRAQACPVAFGNGSPFRALPCVGVEAGAHHGESASSPSLTRGGSATVSFVAPFAEARAEAAWGKLFVEIAADARFPLRHPTFFFDDRYRAVYTVNPVAFGLSAGFGLRL